VHLATASEIHKDLVNQNAASAHAPPLPFEPNAYTRNAAPIHPTTTHPPHHGGKGAGKNAGQNWSSMAPFSFDHKRSKSSQSALASTDVIKNLKSEALQARAKLIERESEISGLKSKLEQEIKDLKRKSEESTKKIAYHVKIQAQSTKQQEQMKKKLEQVQEQFNILKKTKEELESQLVAQETQNAKEKVLEKQIKTLQEEIKTLKEEAKKNSSKFKTKEEEKK